MVLLENKTLARSSDIFRKIKSVNVKLRPLVKICQTKKTNKVM